MVLMVVVVVVAVVVIVVVAVVVLVALVPVMFDHEYHHGIIPRTPILPIGSHIRSGGWWR